MSTTPLHRKRLEWRYSVSTGHHDIRLTSALRAWHRARLIGLKIDAMQWDGRQLSVRELERLNYWVEARGAWRCSLLPWHEAAFVLAMVISGELRHVHVGPGGAGRWPAGTRAEILLGDGRQCVQGELGL